MSKRLASRRSSGPREDDGPHLFPPSLPPRQSTKNMKGVKSEKRQKKKSEAAAAANTQYAFPTYQPLRHVERETELRESGKLNNKTSVASSRKVARRSNNDFPTIVTSPYETESDKKIDHREGKQHMTDSRKNLEHDDQHGSFSNRPRIIEDEEAIQPGAVAVGGMGAGIGAQYASSLNITQNNNEDRSQPASASHEDLPDATPIPATLVEDEQPSIPTQVDSTEDIEDQVRRQILDEAVHADVVDHKQIRKRRFIIGVVVAIVLIAIGVALGVSLGGNSSSSNNGGESSTQTPSAAPTGRVDILLDLLEAEFGEIFPNSPQSDAVDWLAFSDPLQLDPGTAPNRIIRERYVIALLYFATNGTNWVDQFGFLNASSVCSWHEGIDSFLGRGVFCEDANGASVTHIKMDSNNLVGKFPAELTALASLKTIDLHNNTLSSTIPDKIGDLNDLVTFVVENNKISGTIPGSLFDLQQLSDLDISSNRDITGTLPANVGNAQRLYTIRLGNCRLQGSIPPSIGQLSELYEVSLASNSLTGNVPSLSGRSLRHLLLSFNNLNGTISSSIGSLRNLYELDLRLNSLKGSIPSLEGSPSLGSVWLHDNELTGTIGDVLATLPASNLVDLNLRTNRLEGSLTPDIGRFEELTALRLNENDLLTGTLPTEIGQLTKLQEYLRLNECNFGGQLPTELGQLTNLWRISVSKNSFSGTIPSEFGLLSTMSSANFQQNRLGGPVPVELTSLPVLDYLYLDNNELTGDVGLFICNRTVEHVFSADCLGPDPEIECSCCTTCCRQDPDNQCQ